MVFCSYDRMDAATGTIRRREGGTDLNWYEMYMKQIDYKGCRNCKHQIDVLRTCEWMERGGDGRLHLICPKWERRTE